MSRRAVRERRRSPWSGTLSQGLQGVAGLRDRLAHGSCPPFDFRLCQELAGVRGGIGPQCRDSSRLPAWTTSGASATDRARAAVEAAEDRDAPKTGQRFLETTKVPDSRRWTMPRVMHGRALPCRTLRRLFHRDGIAAAPAHCPVRREREVGSRGQGAIMPRRISASGSRVRASGQRPTQSSSLIGHPVQQPVFREYADAVLDAQRLVAGLNQRASDVDAAADGPFTCVRNDHETSDWIVRWCRMPGWSGVRGREPGALGEVRCLCTEI